MGYALSLCKIFKRETPFDFSNSFHQNKFSFIFKLAAEFDLNAKSESMDWSGSLF